MVQYNSLQKFESIYKEKFLPVDQIFKKIHLGDRIFISTACGEPQYLVNSMVKYVENHPKALLDSEVI